MNRELEIRERVAQYGLALHEADREALDMARGNLEFYAYSDLRHMLDETARLRAELDAARSTISALESDKINATMNVEHLAEELEAAQKQAEAAERIAATDNDKSYWISVANSLPYVGNGFGAKQELGRHPGQVRVWTRRPTEQEWHGPDAEGEGKHGTA